MKERIIELRELLDLSQTRFAKKLGVSQNAIWRVEQGISQVTSGMINSICYKFNVNEKWLRTGEGEIFKPCEEKYDSGFPEGSAHDEFMKLCATLDEEQLEIVLRLLKSWGKEQSHKM